MNVIRFGRSCDVAPQCGRRAHDPMSFRGSRYLGRFQVAGPHTLDWIRRMNAILAGHPVVTRLCADRCHDHLVPTWGKFDHAWEVETSRGCEAEPLFSTGRCSAATECCSRRERANKHFPVRHIYDCEFNLNSTDGCSLRDSKPQTVLGRAPLGRLHGTGTVRTRNHPR